MGTMLQGMLAGVASPAAAQKSAGKRKAPGTPAGAAAGAANKRAAGGASSSRGSRAAAAAAASEIAQAEAAAEREKKAAALKQKNEPWRVERADGTSGTWPGAVSDEQLLEMVKEFGEVRRRHGCDWRRQPANQTSRERASPGFC